MAQKTRPIDTITIYHRDTGAEMLTRREWFDAGKHPGYTDDKAETKATRKQQREAEQEGEKAQRQLANAERRQQREAQKAETDTAKAERRKARTGEPSPNPEDDVNDHSDPKPFKDLDGSATLPNNTTNPPPNAAPDPSKAGS